ncbi:MAG: cellulase family glycosylhydrolase, partial [Clostridia bacterium]|nr:cellulase family glycosylhydrolase [Clostridia bacterium]
LLMLFSCFATLSVSADTQTLSEKLTDTSDFSLSSIEYTEQMLIAYNIGNCFEMTELRPAYVRPEISNINDHIRYKETMAGNVLVTEEYIKYLKSIGIQAIRLPVTWFNMLEDENGNIYPKDTWYASKETRQKAWYNGKINEEFLARVKQVVDWIIENDMYCMINTHHDAAANTSNPVNPIIMDIDHKEQTYNYLSNIWGQVGSYFKNYGSKLMFEFYNEATSNSGHMTPSDTADDFTSDLLCHLISLIRSQGSNNANRFLVCPRYGGVSMWSNNEYLQRFVNSDTADDKIVVTTHTYTSVSSMPGSIRSIRTWMNNTGIGAIIDEFGATDAGSNLKEKSINSFASVRKASDEHKVSCWFWDGGHQDCALTNRYYLKPSAPALGAYVGKDIEFENYTKEEVLSLTQSTQPNWVELYTEDGSDYAGKYLLLTSANKINNLYKSGNYAGYYSHDGAENGLFTYFTSDDGVNYNLMSTNVPTPWTQIAWKQLQVSGSTYYTKQVDGNYQIEKIGDGLQDYVATGDNLIPLGGEWQKGHYATNGKYEGEGTTYYNARISLKNKIAVLPDNFYQFHLVEKGTRYQFIIRSYDANGNFVKNLGTITNGALQMPSNAYYISVSLYDSHQTENGDKLFSYLEDGTFKPTMYLYVDAGSLECKHSPVENSGVVFEPTCKAQGYTEYTCEICSKTYRDDFVEKLSSCVADDSKDNVVPPNCGEEGYTEHTCKFCKENFKTDIVPATGNHTLDESKDNVVLPTCTEKGYTEHYCTVCKKTYKTDETDIDPDAHNIKTAQAVESTCTETGLTEGKYCDKCGETLVAQEETSKKPHTEYVSSKGYEATCKGAGYTDEISCSVCGELLVERERIPLLQHVEKVDRGYSATCSKTGLTNGKHCSVCGEVTLAQKEISKLSHTVSPNLETVKEPTETDVGEKVKKCLVCGEVVETEVIEKLEPTVCVHTTVIKNLKKATYFAKGYTGDTVCVECGEITLKGKATDKLTLKVLKFKLTKGKKQFKVKYTKVADATGFQVRYKVKGKWKIKTFKATKTVTKTIKKLKKGNYKVQVRAMIVNGKLKAYSKWAKVKRVKVK